MNMMKLAPLALLLTAACAPQQWTRPGVTDAQRLSDTDECQADANTKAPLSFAPTGAYIWASPTTPLSNYNGTLPSGLGPAYNGEQTYIDANQDVRDRIFRDCMTSRGYSLTNPG